MGMGGLDENRLRDGSGKGWIDGVVCLGGSVRILRRESKI